MTEDGDRLDAHGDKRIGKGGLNRKEQRLGDLRIGQLLVEVGIRQKLGQRDVRMELEKRTDRGETLAEVKVFTERFDAHAGPLRAVARKDEGDLGISGDGFADFADIRARFFHMARDRTNDIFGMVAAGCEPIAHMRAVGTGSRDH